MRLNGTTAADSSAQLLRAVSGKGVRLWSENGQLRFRAPKGALSSEEIEVLRAASAQIVALLGNAVSAPATFTQLAHWKLYRLDTRPAIRQIARALHLFGPLSVETLQQSLGAVVQRHDALRTRIVVVDGAPTQQVAESISWSLQRDDLSWLSPASREARLLRLIEESILHPVDVAADPLFGVRLVRLGEREHALIVTMEHMISDMFSMDVVCREILTAYEQAMNGEPISLPPVTMQFSDYAMWQRATLNARLTKHSSYWNDQIARSPRLMFPRSRTTGEAQRSGWGVIPLHIGHELKECLSEWSRSRRTTLAMSMFAAYAATLLRWCGASEGVIRYQSDGRSSANLGNTVGFLASALYLRVESRGGELFSELLERVIAEYCRAYEHADAAYFAAQASPPAFTCNPMFNWVPAGNAVGAMGSDGRSGGLLCRTVPFTHPMLKHLDLDHEPTVMFFDTGEEISGEIHFCRTLFSTRSMEQFRDELMASLQAMSTEPSPAVHSPSISRKLSA